LIPETKEQKKEDKNLIELEIEKIKPNPYQPREKYDPEKLTELANSIKEKGLVQPVVVRKTESGFELVAGERRLKAAKSIGLRLIPALIKENLTKSGMLELSLVENVQREDLNPIETAKGYRRLLNELGLSQNEISQRVGKERSSVANTIRLLNLSSEIQELLLEGKLSEGHARAILAVNDPEKQLLIARRIIKDTLSVRETEAIVYPEKGKKISKKRIKVLSPRLQEIEDKLREFFGTSVRLVQRKKRGRIEIEFYSEDDLNRILEILNLDLG